MSGEELVRSASASRCLPPTDETGGGPKDGEGPWLIFSHYWGRWHRRSEDGGACGYTDDMAHAGIFGLEKAREYHDPPGRDQRDEAIPVARALYAMEDELKRRRAACDDFAAKIDGIRAALVAPEARATAQPNLSAEGAQQIDEVNRKPTEPNTSKYSPNQHNPSPSASAGGDGEEHQS